MVLQSSGETRREIVKACRQPLRGPSFETPLWRLLRILAAPQDKGVTSGAISDPHGEEAHKRRLLSVRQSAWAAHNFGGLAIASPATRKHPHTRHLIIVAE